MKRVLACIALLLMGSPACRAQTSPPSRWVIQPPATGVYTGAFVGKRSNERNCLGLSRALGQTLQLCDTYYAIGTVAMPRNRRLTSEIAEQGTIPVGTLGCKGNGSPEDGGHTTFAQIAAGDQDAALSRDAAELKSYASRYPKNPWLFIRLFHEFNVNTGNPRGNPNGNNCFSMPEDVPAMQHEFVAAWRHVVTFLAQQGVKDVTWVWCPATGPQAWRRHGGNDFLRGFYPGDAYVDWTCADTYDKAPGGGGVANAYQHLELFKQIGKPFMIAETGECNAESHSRSCGAYRHTQAEYIADTAKSLMPGGYLYSIGTKAWIYFDNNVERSGYDWSLDTQGLAALRELVRNPYFHPPMPPPKMTP